MWRRLTRASESLSVKRYGSLIRFTSSSVFLQGVRVACNLAVLAWVEPKAIGLWQSLVLIETYSTILQGGVLNGLNRELPFSFGRGDKAAAEVLAGTAERCAVIGVSCCLLLVLGVPGLGKADNVSWGLLIVLVSSAAGIYRNYLGATYRAAGSFDTLARIQIAEALLAVLSLPLVLGFGYWGLAGRYAILRLAGVTLNYILRPLRTVGDFDWQSLGILLKSGIPVFVFGYLIGVAGTFPRLVLLDYGGVQWVGVFAPAAAVIGGLRTVPVALSRFVYPQMSFRLGQTNDRSVLWPIAWKTAIFSLFFAVPVIVVLLAFIPVAIRYAFPEYSDSVPAIRWALVAGGFMGCSVALNALNSLRAWGPMGVYVAARLTLLYALPTCGAEVFSSLEGVALGMACAEALLFVIGLGAIRIATKEQRSGREVVRS